MDYLVRSFSEKGAKSAEDVCNEWFDVSKGLIKPISIAKSSSGTFERREEITVLYELLEPSKEPLHLAS